MPEYNERLILGKSMMLLDDAQKSYLEFEEYAHKEKYIAYLEKASSEAEMQYFFESNPMLIPGLYDLHNGPLGNVVISKLKLAEEYVTDFAFISINSAVSQITLVEIESPKLEVFRKSDDQFTSEFNKAYQQVRDWGLWAEQNATYLKDRFRTIYFKNVFKYQRVITRRILVAGRRAEIQQNPRRERRWASISHDSSTVIMSYDRLYDIFNLKPILLRELTCRPARYISSFMKIR
jgi:hypothetical protein